MSTRFHIGANQAPRTIAAYAKRFDFLEVPTGVSAANAPGVATMRRWRKSVAPHFDFCVVAGQNLAALKPSELLDREVAIASEAIDALRARCLLIRTPVEVTPSRIWRDRMSQVIERFPRDATKIVWEPRGVWETEDAAVAAKRWEILLCVDASRDPVPVGPTAYVRLRALGETRSFGVSTLERVIRAIGSRRDAYVVFETAGAVKEAKLFRQVSKRRMAGFEGGTGRIIRPRALPVSVGDDEQE